MGELVGAWMLERMGGLVLGLILREISGLGAVGSPEGRGQGWELWGGDRGWSWLYGVGATGAGL